MPSHPEAQLVEPAAGVRALFDAVLAGDVDTIAALLHPDLEVIEPESLPYGGVYRGKDAFLTDLFPKLTGLVDVGIEGVRILGEESVAMAQMDGVFTARRTGAQLRMPYVEVYEFDGGLISRITVYPADTKALADFLTENG